MSEWSFNWNLWTLLISLVLLAVSVALSAANVRRDRRTRGAAALEGLRILVVILLVVTLLRPERVRRVQRSGEPVVSVLCDLSGSMDTVDVVTTNREAVSRRSWIEARTNLAHWASLESRYRVALETFSTQTKPDVENPDPGTDINSALMGSLTGINNLRAVILLSDGDWNEGASPVTAASRLRMQGVPVFGVGVGSDQFLPDLELVSVSVPAYALMDEHLSLPFTIQSRLPREVKTTVTLRGKGGELASREVTIPPMAQYQDTILLQPPEEGQQTFTLSVPLQREEVLRHNNEREFSIALRRELLKVLVVESSPRWEYRYLRNALDRDPGVDVTCVLLHPHMAPGGGRTYIPSFPASREELSEFDVVFLGDIGLGAGGIPPESAELLKGLVEQQGSGLVFLPGRDGRQASFAETPLEEICPVVTEPDSPGGFGIGLESKLTLTAIGREHLLTMLGDSPAQNQAIWRTLPGFYWHAGVVKSKPGTDVLAVHSTARNEFGRVPLLVTRAAGNGKVLFMGTDSAWRWRRGIEDTFHYRFWGQVVRWMSHQRHLAHDQGIRLFYSPEVPRRGQRVLLHATVFDRAGLPLDDATVTATITREDGTSESLQLEPSEGGWGVFTGHFEPEQGGEYRVEVYCVETERRIESSLVVASPQRERVGRPVRISVLREISSLTGGRVVTPSELNSLIEQVRLLPESSSREERMRLWCHPVWGGLIVCLLAAYWVGRKLQGKI